MTPEWTRLEALVRELPPPGKFTAEELAGAAEPVRRYFQAGIAPGTPLAAAVRIEMRGSIKGVHLGSDGARPHRRSGVDRDRGRPDRRRGRHRWAPDPGRARHRPVRCARQFVVRPVGRPRQHRHVGRHPFGVEVTGQGTFDGVTIPATGRAGWHFGTDRWDSGVFFRYEITGYELVT